jgi:hypothetical protein
MLNNKLQKGFAETTGRTSSEGAVGRHSLTYFLSHAISQIALSAARSGCASRR